MTRVLFFVLLTSLSTTAAAFQWPWSETSVERVDYCKGFIIGGLSSNQVAGVSRTDLWLAWNYLIRMGMPAKDIVVAEYTQGRDNFPAGMQLADVTALLDDTAEDCGRGRSGRQVTGW